MNVNEGYVNVRPPGWAKQTGERIQCMNLGFFFNVIGTWVNDEQCEREWKTVHFSIHLTEYPFTRSYTIITSERHL